METETETEMEMEMEMETEAETEMEMKTVWSSFLIVLVEAPKLWRSQPYGKGGEATWRRDGRVRGAWTTSGGGGGTESREQLRKKDEKARMRPRMHGRRSSGNE
jgi:hypothetical protein